MPLSDSTTSEDVTTSSFTSSVSTFVTLSTSAVSTESFITSGSFSASSTSESTSSPPTTSTAESVTNVASTSLSAITTAFQTSVANPTTASASTTVSTTSSSASNVPYVDMYDYLGCLESQEEFPSFTEIATASDMTVEKCIEIGSGSQYIGVHRRSCYKADNLSGTDFTADSKCNIRCPGDSTVLCGGDNNAQTRRRRSIPSNFFLTLYRLSASASSASSASLSSTLMPSSPVVTSPTSTAHLTTSRSDAGSSSDDIATKTAESTVITDIATSCITRTTLTDTVTSVTYVTVDSSLSVVTTCVPVTLVYSPCGCEHETYPAVDMVTVTSPCSTHGSYRKDITTLTIPKACETLTSDGQPAVQYPSGWISSQTYSGHGSYYLAQPTAGPQTESGPDNKQPSRGKASAGGAKAKPTDRPQKATGELSSETGSEGNGLPKTTPNQSIPSAPQYTGSPQSSVHYEQIPAKESNAPDTPSSSWTTHHGNYDTSAAASKTGSTDEVSQSNVPSESGAKGSAPVTVSGASRHRCVTWAVVGIALMFY
ncbi:extracellular alpha-1 4-glucan glucosidase [Fusarium tjaetaba]|uniref:Extracellular alpha-1 4-glucan glucosidase n=1 Tax=Fusarium tjaetaba TaxID=1567544 RepID=A0A8H5R1K6_9HYPO|nr:extracellular alpha-1 4-glucan glucosidase [Fusarium tjaetaba]KAF5624808.1 extracellular alpha-1 4-glucan glucosidase [Fusarium tjaetaba]